MKVVANVCGIQSRDFSIIASNCTGTLPYRFLKLRLNTPTANLFFFAPCYLKFIRNLEHYINTPLVFYPQSRYPEGEQIRTDYGRQYPIGTLDDIEVHFMHYQSAAEAKNKWDTRKKRINYNKLIFAFTDKDLCTPELLREFDALDYPEKYVLTAKPWPELDSAIQVPAFADSSEIGDCYTHYNHLAHVNFRRLIDGSVKREQPQPVLYAD